MSMRAQAWDPPCMRVCMQAGMPGQGTGGNGAMPAKNAQCGAPGLARVQRGWLGYRERGRGRTPRMGTSAQCTVGFGGAGGERPARPQWRGGKNGARAARLRASALQRGWRQPADYDGAQSGAACSNAIMASDAAAGPCRAAWMAPCGSTQKEGRGHKGRPAPPAAIYAPAKPCLASQATAAVCPLTLANPPACA